MTEFKPGDRVRVTYDTIVKAVSTDQANIQHPSDDRFGTAVPLSALTRLPDPLPTTPESVIRVTEVHDEIDPRWLGAYVLGVDGIWRDADGVFLYPGEIAELATRWEVIYDAGKSESE